MKLGIVSPGRTSSGGSAFSGNLVPALEKLLRHPVVSVGIPPTGTFRPPAALMSCTHVVFIGSRAERISGAKIIFWPLNVAPLEKHVVRTEASSLKNRLRHLALLQRLRRSVAVADGMVFGSMHARTLYQAEFPAAARLPYQINRGGAASLAASARAETADPLVLLVSHLYPYKGILQFVDAVAQAADRLPDAVRFRVAGADRDARYADAVRQRARELGMETRIEIRPADPQEMANLYASATICVFTSTCENAGSFALYDGLHTGVPTICSDRSSMPEMVGDAVRLINPYSTAELADEIVALLSDEASRKELSAASLRWSAASPNWDDRAAQLLEFIEGRAL
jgi:glycosyltransferase involved in cell wall biosynthesis